LKVLDSDTCIAILRGREDVLARYAAEADEVVTTWVTACELSYGAAMSRDPDVARDRVGQLLGSLDVLGLDLASAQVFGDTKALLRRAGWGLADADLLIASIALVHGAPVVTGSRRHFRRIPGLVVEDWIRA